MVTVNFFHEGREITAVKPKADREGGIQQRVRRLLAWKMLKGMEGVAKKIGSGWKIRVDRAGTATPHIPEDYGEVHASPCLRGEGMNF